MKSAARRIFVGLSGGVDSAVTAAILAREGAEVTGVFIKGWYPEGLPCTWAEDRRDAMRVAARLGIRFETLDAGAVYKRAVIDYLIREYAAGRTPNPDIMCNREVKFGAFYDYARKRGADFIATGHYARLVDSNAGPKLLRGTDREKDQSYFLWALAREVLPRVLFPLGGMEKADVRRRANGFNLPNASKRDSQGICFLGPVSVEDFLRAEVGLAKGKACDTDGREIGTHEGAMAYTLGERAAITGDPGPWYVLAKDLVENTITVTHVPSRMQRAHAAISVERENWLQSPGSHMTAQYRYHGPILSGQYEQGSFTPAARIDELLAAGQSLVFYDGEELIGGGIIAA